MFEYPISAPCSVRLTKYIGTNLSSLFATSTVLTALFYVTGYIVKTSPRIGGIKGSLADVIFDGF